MTAADEGVVTIDACGASLSDVARTLASVAGQTVLPPRVDIVGDSNDAALASITSRFGEIIHSTIIDKRQDAEGQHATQLRFAAGDALLPAHLETVSQNPTGDGASYDWQPNGSLHPSDPSSPREPTHLRCSSRASPVSADGATVSVIVPAYQSDATIHTALASIVSQTRPPDEVIVVDDASADETAAVAQRFSAVLPLQVIRKQKNEGQGAGRRDAIADASGDHLALLDADDYWFPDHLERLLLARVDSRSLVSGLPLRWQPDRPASGPHQPVLAAEVEPSDQWRMLLIENFVFVGSLFRRDAYERAGGFREWRGVEDWDLWMRMVRSGSVVVRTSTPSVLYRVHAGSTTSGSHALLPANLELMQTVLDELDGRDALLARRTIRSIQNMIRLVDARELAAAGHPWRARRLNFAAVLHERSLRSAGPFGWRLTARALVRTMNPSAAGAASPSRRHEFEKDVADVVDFAD